MELRKKVAFLLIAVVWFLAVCSVCTPQSLRNNPFERYLNKQKHSKSKYLSKYEIKDRHEDFQGQKVYKTFNFPEVDHPSDTSSKVPIYLPKTKFDSSSKTSSFDVLSDSDFLNNLRKEKRRKRRYQQIQKPYTREDQTILSVPEYFHNQEPSFFFTDMGLFPEVQYPLTAAETWTPHYWNPLLSINKDPYFKINDDLYQNTPQKKKNTDTFIQPSAINGNKGMFAVVKKSKEEIPKIDILKNITGVKNDKELKITTRKKKTETGPTTGKLLKKYKTTEMPLKLEEKKIKSKEHTSPGITKKNRNSLKKTPSEAQKPSKEPNSLKKIISESSNSRFKSRQFPKIAQHNNKTNTDSPESFTIQCIDISGVNNKTGNFMSANSSVSNILPEHSRPKLSPDFNNGIPMNSTVKNTFTNVPLQLLTDTISKTVLEDQTCNNNSEIIPEVPLLEDLAGHSVSHNLVNDIFEDELIEKNSKPPQGKIFGDIDDIDNSNTKFGNDLFILNATLTDMTTTTPLIESYAAYPISHALNALQNKEISDLPKNFNKNSVRKQILDVVLSSEKLSVSSVKNKIFKILETEDFNSNEEEKGVLIYKNPLNEAINELQAVTDSPESTLFDLMSTNITESLTISPNTIITDNPTIDATELITIPIETLGTIEVNPVTKALADNLREIIAKPSSSNSLIDDLREIIRLLTVWNSHIYDSDDVIHKTTKNEMKTMNWTEFIPKSEKLIEFIPDFTSRNAFEDNYTGIVPVLRSNYHTFIDDWTGLEWSTEVIPKLSLLADDSGEYIPEPILTDDPEKNISELILNDKSRGVIPEPVIYGDSSGAISNPTLNEDLARAIAELILNNISVGTLPENTLNNDLDEVIPEPALKEDLVECFPETTLYNGPDIVFRELSLTDKSDKIFPVSTINDKIDKVIPEPTNDDSEQVFSKLLWKNNSSRHTPENKLNDCSDGVIAEPVLNEDLVGGIPKPTSNENVDRVIPALTFNDDSSRAIQKYTLNDDIDGDISGPTLSDDSVQVISEQTLNDDSGEFIANPTLDNNSTGVNKETLGEKKYSSEIITYFLPSDSDMLAKHHTYNLAEITTDSGVNDNYTLVEKPPMYSSETKIESNGTFAERPTMDYSDAVSNDTDNADTSFPKNGLSKAWASEMPSTFMYHDIVSLLAQEEVSNHPISFVSTNSLITDNNIKGSKDIISEHNLIAKTLADDFSKTYIDSKVIKMITDNSLTKICSSKNNASLPDNSDEDNSLDKEIKTFPFYSNEDFLKVSLNDALAIDSSKVKLESESKIIKNGIHESPNNVFSDSELDDILSADSNEEKSKSNDTLSGERFIENSLTEYSSVFAFDDIFSSLAEENEAVSPISFVSTYSPSLLSNNTLLLLQNEAKLQQKYFLRSDENESEEVCPITEESSFKNQCYIFDEIDDLNSTSNLIDILSSGQIRSISKENSTDPSIDNFSYKKQLPDILLVDLIAAKPMIDSSEEVFGFPSRNNDILAGKHTIDSSELTADLAVNNDDKFVEKPTSYSSETVTDSNDILAEKSTIGLSNFVSDTNDIGNKTFFENSSLKTWPTGTPSAFIYHDIVSSLAEKKVSEYPTSFVSTYMHSSDSMTDNSSREIIAEHNLIAKPLTVNSSKTLINSKGIQTITKISSTEHISKSARNDSLPDNSAKDDPVPKYIGMFTTDSSEDIFELKSNDTFANDDSKVSSESESYISTNDVHHFSNDVVSDSEQDSASLSTDSSEEKSNSRDTFSDERYTESLSNEFPLVFTFDDMISSSAEEEEVDSPISFISTLIPSFDEALFSLQNETETPQNQFIHSDENRSEDVCPFTEDGFFKTQCYTFDEIDDLNSTSNLIDILSSGQIRLISKENSTDPSIVNFPYQKPLPDILLVDLIAAKPMIDSSEVVFGFPSRNNDILAGKHTIDSSELTADLAVNNDDKFVEKPTSYSSETVTDSNDILAERSTIGLSNFVSDTNDVGNKTVFENSSLKTWPTGMPSAFIYHDIVSSLAEEKVSEYPTSFVSTYMHSSDSMTDNSSREIIAEHNLIAKPLTDNSSKTLINSKGIQTITKISSTEHISKTAQNDSLPDNSAKDDPVPKYIGMFTIDSSEEIFELKTNDTFANDNSKVSSESESYISTNNVHYFSNDVVSDSDQDSASLSTDSSEEKSYSRDTFSDDRCTESISNEFPLVFNFDDIISSSAEEDEVDSPISFISTFVPSSVEALLSLQSEAETPQNQFIHSHENISEEVCPFTEDSCFKSQCFTFDEIGCLNLTRNLTDILALNSAESAETPIDSSNVYLFYKTPRSEISLADLIMGNILNDTTELHDKETLSNISKSIDMSAFNVISEFSDYISEEDTSNYVDDTFRNNIVSNETSSGENLTPG